MIFHFLSPSPEEQTGVARVQIGTVLALVLIGVLLALNQGAAPVLFGGLVALMVNFFRVQSEFDKRKKRGEKGEISLSLEHLRIFDGGRGQHLIAWNDIKSLDSRGGKLQIHWSGPTQILALREVENGMQLLEEMNRRMQKDNPKFSNFIPLEPM